MSPSLSSTSNFLSHSLGAHVRGGINLIGKLRNVHLNATLDLIQYLLIGITRNERNGKTFGAKATGAAHTMQILVHMKGEQK